jgi:hypothetical protein
MEICYAGVNIWSSAEYKFYNFVAYHGMYSSNWTATTSRSAHHSNHCPAQPDSPFSERRSLRSNRTNRSEIARLIHAGGCLTEFAVTADLYGQETRNECAERRSTRTASLRSAPSRSRPTPEECPRSPTQAPGAARSCHVCAKPSPPPQSPVPTTPSASGASMWWRACTERTNRLHKKPATSSTAMTYIVTL